jgi:hypothetical protein
MDNITKKLRYISKSRNVQKIIYEKPKRKYASMFIDSDDK